MPLSRALRTLRALLAPSVAAFVAFGGEPLIAQESADEAPPPIEIGHQYTISSEILGEDRPIWIGLPAGYDRTDEPYPVVYLLDGQSNFHHTTGSVRHLASTERMPAAIVVGVGNISAVQRTRDMTPTPALEEESANNPMMESAGGATDFLRFLTDELRPWVDDRYRTRPFDILIGHSLGGLFITEVINRAPASFDAYISISPSLWWNDEAWVEGLDDLFERHPDAAGALYMTMGNEGGNMLSGAWTFAGTLEKDAPADFRWKWNHMPNESHGSVPYRSTHDGLEWIFDGWDPTPIMMPVIQDEAPVGPMLDALEAHYEAVSARFGWEVPPRRALVSSVGGYLTNEGRKEEALEAFMRNVAWHPDAPQTHAELATALLARCRWDEARRHYGHARARAESAGNEALVARMDEQLAEVDQLAATAGACIESASGAAAAFPSDARWEWQLEDSTALYIALAVVDENTVWASGSGGRVARTVDGGATWSVTRVPGEDKAQFRDVHAVSADEAYLLSIPTPISRIYHTADGGATWTAVFEAESDAVFMDCFAFWDDASGFAFADSQDGEFILMRSRDGGPWSRIDPAVVPDAREGEGAFAASGTCTVARPGGLGWFATGASGVDARVIRTTDYGETWAESITPLPSADESSGIFALTFRDDLNGAAFGGALSEPDSTHTDVAVTTDGGDTWSLVGSTGLRGAVYGATWVPGTDPAALVAASPDGTAVSTDGGRTWTRIDSEDAWTVAFHGPDVGWAAGRGGIRALRRAP